MIFMRYVIMMTCYSNQTGVFADILISSANIIFCEISIFLSLLLISEAFELGEQVTLWIPSDVLHSLHEHNHQNPSSQAEILPILFLMLPL